MPLQKILLVTFFLLFAGICNCQDNQDKKDSAYFADMPVTYVHLLGDTSQSKPVLPFTGVKVIDARFDTSVAGYSRKTNTIPAHKIIFASNAAGEIQTYLTKKFDLNDETGLNKTLVIILEKLWLSSSFIDGKKEKWDVPVVENKTFIGKKRVEDMDAPTMNNVVMVNAKILAKINDSYYSIYSIDSFYITGREILMRTESSLVETGIDSMLAKLVNKKSGDLRISKRPLTDSSITSFIASRFSQPVITQPYATGVFKTFDEFKNNRPSILNFETSKTNKVDMLYVKEPGNNYLLREFWGFSDGKNVYINKGNNFFRLFKQGKTFVFFGFNTIIKTYSTNWGQMIFGGIIPNAMGAATEIKYEWKKIPLQVDMETGDCW